MSQYKKKGGVALFGSSKPALNDDESSSSDEAPEPQQIRKKPSGRAQVPSSSSVDSDSERQYYEDDESEDESESDESLEELQRELEEIPFEELRKMQREEGIGIKRRRPSESDANSKENEKSTKKKSKDSTEKKLSKRQAKNAPIVVSAKAPLSHRPRQVVPLPKRETRDPRFDSLSGKFNEETFRRSYGFIDQIKNDELKELKAAIRKEKNKEERAKLKEALQIMENRQRAETQKRKQREILQKHKKAEREKVKEGKNPYFLKKQRVKELELQDKFEELKKKGGESEVDRYLRDKRKRKAQKEIRYIPYKRRAVEGADGMPTVGSE